MGNWCGFVLVRSSVGLTLKPSIKCFLCNGGSKLETCGQFRAKLSEEKLKVIRDRKLCENCLSYCHFASAHEAVLLSSAPLPVSICKSYTMLWLLVFEVEMTKQTVKEFLVQVLINSLPSYTCSKVEAFDTEPEIKLCLLCW